MNSIVITGATSLIGIGLCEYLLSYTDITIYAVCRPGSNSLKRLPTNNKLKIIFANLENILRVEDHVTQADTFINLAWDSTDHEGRNNAKLQELNVEYAKEAMRLAARLGCKLFVEAGSQAEYGFVPGLIGEETPCNPEVEYGRAKLRVLEEGILLCKNLGLKYLHLRIFSVFGENDRPWTLIMSSIEKLLKSETLELSSCQQNWNYLYVTDCAKQIVLLSDYALEKIDFIFDVFHIASNDTRQLKDYVEEMRSVLKSPSEIHYGSFIPPRQVSLNPSVLKTERAIGFTNQIHFADALKIIINKKYNIQL